jgi:3-oxoacyl-[acyl-carrier protein] reductase
MDEPTVALVTGASKGIGRAVARALAGAGHTVAVGYRSDPSGAEDAAAEASAAGGRAVALAIDVADEASVEAAFKSVEEDLGSVGILVNNAGMSRDGLILKYPTEAWDATMDTNLRGAFLCARRAARGMARARWGRIVNVSSIAAIRGNAGQVAYCASKAGLLGLTRALARELGGRGVTTNAVCPGYVDTAMTSTTPEEMVQLYLQMTPAGRMGTLDEIAAVVVFLCSPQAAYVNGAVITVDGGLTA